LRRLNHSQNNIEFADWSSIIADLTRALELFARRGEKDLFLAATNSPKLLYGWRRHEELYAAFRDPSREHIELGKDILRFAAERGDRSSVAIDIAVVPLGVYPKTLGSASIWVASYQRYRCSTEFRQMMRDIGVYDYWRKYGFPPQCKAIEKDDFECD